MKTLEQFLNEGKENRYWQISVPGEALSRTFSERNSKPAEKALAAVLKEMGITVKFELFPIGYDDVTINFTSGGMTKSKVHALAKRLARYFEDDIPSHTKNTWAGNVVVQTDNIDDPGDPEDIKGFK